MQGSAGQYLTDCLFTRRFMRLRPLLMTRWPRWTRYLQESKLAISIPAMATLLSRLWKRQSEFSNTEWALVAMPPEWLLYTRQYSVVNFGLTRRSSPHRTCTALPPISSLRSLAPPE